jgi:hypothetical protein
MIKCLVYVPPDRLSEAVGLIMKHLDDNIQVRQTHVLFNLTINGSGIKLAG